jgi:hypothetical protein
MWKISDASRLGPPAVKILAGLAIGVIYVLQNHFGVRAIKTLLGPLLAEHPQAPVIFVNAGRQLAVVHSMSDIMSPAVIGGLAALAVLPWIGKGVMRLLAYSRLRVAGAGV